MDAQLDRSSVAYQLAHAPKTVSIPSDSTVIRQQIIHTLLQTATPEFLLPSPRRVQWEYLVSVLHLCKGNISEAARRLGVGRRTLQRQLLYKDAPVR